MKTLNNEARKNILKETEEYIKKMLDDKNTEVKAHDWKHVFRVRNWALKIARGERYENIFLAEISALIHDLGRLREKELKRPHADVSGIMAKEYLDEKGWFSQEEREDIVYAVAHHSKGGNTPLTHILQDADRLDGFGATGIMRVAQHKWYLPDYEKKTLRERFPYSHEEVESFYQKGLEDTMAPTTADYVKFTVSWYDRMNTKTGKELAEPLIAFTKRFLEELQRESGV